MADGDGSGHGMGHGTGHGIGARIRDLREERALRQADLAAAAGISPSYLALIEGGRRRVAGKRLADIARALDLDPGALAQGADGARVQALRAAAADHPDLRPQPEAARAQELADRFPGWAALVAELSARNEALAARAGELAARLAHDRDLAGALHAVLSGVTSIRAAAAILVENPGLDADWRGRFLANIHADGEALAASSRDLARVLEAPAGAAARSALAEAEAWLDARDHRLPEVEEDRDPPDLPEGPAGPILRAWLARLRADARALPLGPFAEAALRAGHDPAPLARAFDAPLPRVLRRLAVLPRGQGHPPMGLAVADASGTLLHLQAPEGVALPRQGGCPLWPLYEALASPGRPLRAVAALPGRGAPRLLCHAVAGPREPADWDAPLRIEATMLMTPAAGPETEGGAPERLVGPTCRLCPRDGCPARREPPLVPAL